MKNKITWTKTTIEEFFKLFNNGFTSLEEGLYIVKYDESSSPYCDILAKNHYVTFQVVGNELHDNAQLYFNSHIVAYAKLN